MFKMLPFVIPSGGGGGSSFPAANAWIVCRCSEMKLSYGCAGVGVDVEGVVASSGVSPSEPVVEVEVVVVVGCVVVY